MHSRQFFLLLHNFRIRNQFNIIKIDWVAAPWRRLHKRIRGRCAASAQVPEVAAMRARSGMDGRQHHRILGRCGILQQWYEGRRGADIGCEQRPGPIFHEL